MHPMPREGTETVQNKSHEQAPRMHPMPREGTETSAISPLISSPMNASYAP